MEDNYFPAFSVLGYNTVQSFEESNTRHTQKMLTAQLRELEKEDLIQRVV
jgi:DNA-binding HxlR family transcriptional regulator